MHLEEGVVPQGYGRYVRNKVNIIIAGIAALGILAVVSLSVGPVNFSPVDVLKTLFGGHVSQKMDLVVFSIRLPQVLAAVVAGAALASAAAVMQSVLRNPLASPFTLGISHAAAFGAAFSVMVLGAGFMRSSASDAVTIVKPGLATFVAFFFSMMATGAVVIVAHIKRGSPESMVLAGVALGSLCSAGTMFLQYFADDTQLASMVFWTFGDLSRASWRELAILASVSASCILLFILNTWNLNAIDSGEDTAWSLGVNVKVVRIVAMSVASLVTAVTISFVGVIGFVGLVSPHMVRRIIGDDNRFLIPASCVTGSLLLLAADTIARTMLRPQVLPVAILTSFVGAPVFLYLLVKGYKR